jgi:hypothetical protein
MFKVQPQQLFGRWRWIMRIGCSDCDRVPGNEHEIGMMYVNGFAHNGCYPKWHKGPLLAEPQDFFLGHIIRPFFISD